MKTKFFTLFAAFVLLFSANASAQTNGDVNDDGVVNEQDIAAILEIMAEAGGVKEQPKYYWYAGWTEPTAANIGEIINETYPASKTSTTMNPAGKTATSTDGVIMDYNTAKLYNTSANIQYYVVVPNGQGIYDSLGNAMHTSTVAFTNVGTFTNHTIYKSVPNGRSISIIIK
jgi:hypothetical protein